MILYFKYIIIYETMKNQGVDIYKSLAFKIIKMGLNSLIEVTLLNYQREKLKGEQKNNCV